MKWHIEIAISKIIISKPKRVHSTTLSIDEVQEEKRQREE